MSEGSSLLIEWMETPEIYSKLFFVFLGADGGGGHNPFCAEKGLFFLFVFFFRGEKFGISFLKSYGERRGRR